MTFLIVDDDHVQLRMMNRMLSFAGFEVRPCETIREVEDAVIESPGSFELVISDFEMPQGTGLELAEHLQAIDGAPPVMLCTGCYRLPEHDPDLVRAILHKPYVRHQLIDSVHAILGLN